MERAILGHVETNTSGTLGAYEQKPYRAARLGSGVLCPATTFVDGDKIECESPLTTRLRGGMDKEQRPLGEYLCETCGTTFVAVTVSLDPIVRFNEVAVRDTEGFDDDRAEVIGIARALRRGERAIKASRAQAKKPRLLKCPECDSLFENAEVFDVHVRRHEVTT